MPVKFEEICFLWLLIYTRCGKTRFTVVSEQNTEYILVLLFINYCVIFHVNNCKPISALPSIAPCGGALFVLQKAMLLKWTLLASDQCVSASNTAKCIFKLFDRLCLDRCIPTMFSSHWYPLFIALHIVLPEVFLSGSTSINWLDNTPLSILTQDHNH